MPLRTCTARAPGQPAPFASASIHLSIVQHCGVGPPLQHVPDYALSSPGSSIDVSWYVRWLMAAMPAQPGSRSHSIAQTGSHVAVWRAEL